MNNKCAICGTEYFLPENLLQRFVDGEQCVNQEICLNNLKLKQERRREFDKRKQQEEEKRKKREEKRLARIEAERRYAEEQLYRLAKWESYRKDLEARREELEVLNALSNSKSCIKNGKTPSCRIGSKLSRTIMDYNGRPED